MMQEMFLSAARPFYHSADYFVWIIKCMGIKLFGLESEISRRLFSPPRNFRFTMSEYTSFDCRHRSVSVVCCLSAVSGRLVP